MTGIELIAVERQRQIDAEGYDTAHDDTWNKSGELSMAGAAYATVASAQVRGAGVEEFPADMMLCEGDWPWREETWKPSQFPLRNLIRAGALIAAEIDRLQRGGRS